MKILASLFILAAYSWVGAQPSTETIIAFGSCNDEDEPQEMWKEIIAQKPSLWIWGGDNVYAEDGEDLTKLRQRYLKQKSNSDYQALLKNCLVTGTWDDHDYGTNDGGKFFTKKREHKQLLFDFLGFGKNHLAWQHEGVYNSMILDSKNQKIKIINLDTRYFRDTVNKISYTDSVTQKRLTTYQPNTTGDILGEEQWQWLQGELQASDVRLFIINSSIQVIAEDHRFEKWANFPMARQRLFRLIESSKKNILIISGDRHMAEFSQIKLPKLGYPLVDFTSSGLTHTWSEFWEEKNSLRVGGQVIQKTFGLVKVSWSGDAPTVTLQIRGLQGVNYGEHVIQFRPN